jgi:hypothetical protein
MVKLRRLTSFSPARPSSRRITATLSSSSSSPPLAHAGSAVDSAGAGLLRVTLAPAPVSQSGVVTLLPDRRLRAGH